MEIFFGIIALLSFVVLFLFANFIFTAFEHYYGLLFHRPFYVHLYWKLEKLSPNQLSIIKNNVIFYDKLNSKDKKYFEHRVAKFLIQYKFVGKDDFQVTDEVKILIASTAIMLTFGMRNFLFSVIDIILVYPSQYFSTINEVNHKGEFNPRMRMVVFSWEDFIKGFEISNDNLNLGIHEFAHVINYHGLKSDDESAVIFSRMYNKIQKSISEEAYLQKLVASNYFRIYAYTNHFEFLAVILEHYFETPEIFKEKFPDLYQDVGKMLNYK